MATDATDFVIREFLSAVEQVETKLLTWAVVDGGLSYDEVYDLAGDVLARSASADATDLTATDLLRQALGRRLLFRFDLGGLVLYRSRMGESVRLLARLRQILSGRDWRTAPTLVSDFRFVLRPRVYPMRDLTIDAAKALWADDRVLTQPRRQAVEALFADRVSTKLSGFQIRATSRVFRDIDSGRNRGMIVTVGTGSGKTLAFYVPALAHVAGLVKKEEHWTKALALYPRKELLKDQFSTAFAEARRLDSILLSRRKIVIGAFYEDTPYKADPASISDSKAWRRDGNGFLCPFLRCPDCDGDLRWSEADLERGEETLTCADLRCRRKISSDEVALTREGMRERPPDILFTTTEMLNRRMSDGRLRHVFGVGGARRPHLVLLDEVHTYVGTTGAQVAFLIRRWRHAVGKPVQFTGLSATLRNATEFFASLVGLPSSAVEEVAPRPSELTSEGTEYLLALRGDPVSKTALLSTSIQTAMLLGRVLDPRGQNPSNGVYGRKVFAFTDDLDATNRLYHNLLDAEGWDGWGRRRIRAPLSSARARSAPSSLARLIAGQSWSIAEEIGHAEGLGTSLRIGRTSSQDAGVDSDADVIVATASLEVGFDDQEVGAIIQHKAPRDAAAFLQRKGRAGRPRIMRPWTVVVLSDYGRDRLAYQGYDALFDPVLQPRALPIANRYVLRIQATYSLMEWVAAQAARLIPALKGSLFEDWSGPVTGNKPWDRARRVRQEAHAKFLRRLLNGDERLLQSLRQHLVDALRIAETEVDSVLWEPPRALLTAVVPTVLRRLESEWKRVVLRDGEVATDLSIPHAPLPDFVPQNLFSDLNLPEVTVLSNDGQRGPQREDSIPIAQALRILAPGAVTRRFAVMNSRASHWTPLPNLLDSHQDLPIESLCETYEELGPFQITEDGGVTDVRCIRPWTMRPVIPGAEVLPSSKSQLSWRTQIIPVGTGIRFDTPTTSPWSDLIEAATFFVHSHRSHAEIRRFATAAEASLVLRRGREFNPTIRFIDNTGTAPRTGALGFVQFVDAVVFNCRMPDRLDHLELDAGAISSDEMRALRTAYFRYAVIEDASLKDYANAFKREWLHQIYLSAVGAWAIATSVSLERAIGDLHANPSVEQQAMEKVLESIFQTLDVDDADKDDQGDGEGEVDRRQRVHNELLALFGQPAIRERLRELARLLYEPADAGFRSWLRKRYRSTMGAALLAACQELYPEAASDDLLVDLEPGPRPPATSSSGEDEIWITETTFGGGGVLEEVLRRFAEDPRRFFRMAENALEASDFELVDAELMRVLELARRNSGIAQGFADVREADSHAAMQRAVAAARTSLAELGVNTAHAVMSAIHARVLRPGSDAMTDSLLRELAVRWVSYEEQLGMEIDARVFAYMESARTDYDAVLARLDPGQQPTREWRFRAIGGLLWARGHLIRSQSLRIYHPYHPLAEPDRHLLLTMLRGASVDVRLSQKDWRAQLGIALGQSGTARLTADAGEAVALKQALFDLASKPIELDYLQLFPRIEAVVRGPDGFSVGLYLPEAAQ